MSETAALDIYVTGLKNAHAMESQALAIMRPQVKRIENYPQVAARLEQHITETEGQIEDLERLLDAVSSDKSTLKDAALSLAGTFAALGHTPAGDEILKNAFANHAFENYEIAAYTSLITLADAAGANSANDPLNRILMQEREMADWLLENIEALTLQYVSLSEAGETAKR